MVQRDHRPEIIEHWRTRGAAKSIARVGEKIVCIFKRKQLVLTDRDLLWLPTGMLNEGKELPVIGFAQLRIQPEPSESLQGVWTLLRIRVNPDDAVIEVLVVEEAFAWRKGKPGGNPRISIRAGLLGELHASRLRNIFSWKDMPVREQQIGSDQKTRGRSPGSFGTGAIRMRPTARDARRPRPEIIERQ